MLPPIGIGVRRGAIGGQLVGQLLAGDLQLTPVVRRAADEVQLGAEPLGQQQVAGRPQRPVARQHEVDLEAEHGAGGGRHPAVVGLRRADGDQRAGAAAQRLGAQELQLAGLVAAGAEPGQVVALDPQPGPARQPGPPLERGRQRGQPRAGDGIEPFERVVRTVDAIDGDGRRRSPAGPQSAVTALVRDAPTSSFATATTRPSSPSCTLPDDAPSRRRSPW